MEYREYQIREGYPQARIGAGFVERKRQEELFMYRRFEGYQLSVVLEGSGMLIDGDANAWPISRHSAFQCFPGQTLSLFADLSKPWREFQMTVSAPVLESLLTLSAFHDRENVFQIELYPHLTLWMNDITQALASAQPALLIENFFELQRLILNIHMQQEASEDAFALSLIRRASVMALQDPGKPVSISEIADAFYVSQARLSRIFKKYTQTTPLKYLQHLRFCYADRLLHEGRGIREVAAMFGYSDQFSFSKQFKQSMGISPSVSLHSPRRSSSAVLIPI